MNDIEIVKLKPSEWQVYKHIQLEALREDPQAFGAKYDDWSQFSDEKWQERPNDKYTMIFIAKDADNPIGLLGVHNEMINGEKIAHLWGMYVSSKYRGLKIGKQLVLRALDEIKNSTEVKKAKLMVEFEPTPAQLLYKAMGFQPVDTTDYILGDGKTHKLYIMEKKLF